jgi:propanol-preferring alcohol dehydrogenase
MVLRARGERLQEEKRPVPEPTGRQILIRVEACAVCRTDLHVQDGDIAEVRYPIVPGHQAVGEIMAAGNAVTLMPGTRVGAAWLGWTCGECEFCVSGRENLCDLAKFHGCHLDGGFATHMLVDSRYCISLDDNREAANVAPLLCAGLIGYRTLRMAGDAMTIGIYGFGSAAHLVSQIATFQRRAVYAFTRPGDQAAQKLARELGAAWAGGSDQPSPAPLDAALVFAPAGELVPKALRDVKKGGSVVCGGIHMSDIPAFPYKDLWGERQIRSVANLTRQDGAEFMALAAKAQLRPRVTTYPLADANQALDDLRRGAVNGTAVLRCL